MKARAPLGRLCRFAHASALVAALAGAVASTPRVAFAQTDAELKAARELFQEAFKDEQEKRFDVALEKFRRVAAVKQSAAVRYRIASVLESLGRLREAQESFKSLADEKGLAANEQPIAKSAGERAAALDKRLTKLTLSVQDPPADLKITVDGNEIPKPHGTPIVLDPGEHVVVATSSGARPFESRVKLAEGGEVTLGVSLESRAAAPATDETRPKAVPDDPKRDHTLAIVSLAGGGALLVVSGVLLAVREGKISDLHDACPNDVCPAARRDELEGTRDDAKLFGPLAIGTAVVGVAAAGVGAYLLLRPAPGPRDAKPDETRPAAARRAPLVFAAGPTHGGALLGLRGAF